MKAEELRDWFAGQALAGLLPTFGKDLRPGTEDVVAEAAYAIADAMLRARREDSE